MLAVRHLIFPAFLLTTIVGVTGAQGAAKQRVTEQKGSLNTEEAKQPNQKHEPADKVAPPIAEQTSAQVSDTQAAKSGEDAQIQRKLVRYTKWLVVVGAIQFVALIVQAVVFLFTLLAINRQTRASSDTAQRRLRAYVVAELGSILNVADPLPGAGPIPQTEARIIYPNGPVAYIRIKNTGQTPAFEVRHWGNIWIAEYPLKSPLPPKPDGENPIASILGPGIISTKRLLFPTLLTPQQVSDLRNGTIGIYVYGEILYRDAFRVRRFTRYRLMHHAMGGVIGVSTELSFAEGGNEAN